MAYQSDLKAWTNPPDQPAPAVKPPAVQPTAIDLACGAGGASFGLSMAGFDVQAGIDANLGALHTYDINIFGADGRHHDLTDVDLDMVPRTAGGTGAAPSETDPCMDRCEQDRPLLVFAGPPCQGLSDAGGTIDPDDERNELLFATLEWIDALEPEVVIIENVLGLPDLHGDLHEDLEERLAQLGYHVNTVSLDAADYGVPQHRERVFVCGLRYHHNPLVDWMPDPIVDEPVTAGEALDGPGPFDGRDLPAPLSPRTPHDSPVDGTPVYDQPDNPHHRLKYTATAHACGREIERDGETVWMPPNHIAANHSQSARQTMARKEIGRSGSSTTDRRLDPDAPAPTMTVSKGTPPVHYRGPAPPYAEGVPDDPDVRRLTVREVARLQGFPDWYAFSGTKHDRFRQVGNAVPPKLAAAVAVNLADQLDPALVADATGGVA